MKDFKVNIPYRHKTNHDIFIFIEFNKEYFKYKCIIKTKGGIIRNRFEKHPTMMYLPWLKEQ